MIGHIPEIYIAKGGADPHSAKILLGVMNAVYTFHMPLFMMISGYVYSLAYFTAQHTPDRSRIDRQIGNMLLVYIIFNLGYVLMKLPLGDAAERVSYLKALLLIWVKPVYVPYWYLYVLAFYYFVFSFAGIRTGSEKRVLALLSALALLATFTHINWFKITNILYFAVFFYIGMLYSRNRGLVIGNRKLSCIMLAAAVVLTVVCWDRRPFESFDQAVRIEQIPVVKAFVALGFSLFVWAVFEKAEPLRSCRALRMLGRYSLEIYLMHGILLSVFCDVLAKIGVRNLWISAALSFALSTAIPVLFSCLCKKLRIYGLIFKPVTYLSGRRP